MSKKTPDPLFSDYANHLSASLAQFDWQSVELLTQELAEIWNSKRNLFICGNGGSAANALHLATDLIYGIGKGIRPGMKVHALTANAPVMTCLGNDTSYDQIFSCQLEALGTPGDVLITLSGSGNSPNILHVLEKAKSLGIKTWAVLGFSGGKAKSLADDTIHFPVEDMQLAEDFQMIVGHMLMKALSQYHV
jgi:D-sedoheptulose 7-phosphate isomerase